MKIRIFEGLDAYEAHIKAAPVFDVESIVKDILNNVRERGDEALLEYTKNFDGVTLEQLRVPEEQLIKARESLGQELRSTLLHAADNVRRFHQRQKVESELSFGGDGTILGWKVSPIEKVGIYAPGGRAVYPSTVIMNVVPAQVAGVPRVIVVSPPSEDGYPHSLILGTASILGVEEVYSVGGAQSIAALAYGTDSIPSVYKITGPGNAYVAEAKRQVYGKVGIDSFAGPSEIFIVCDQEKFPVEYIVRDLISQAEHDPEARAILLTTSMRQAQQVAQRLQMLIPTLPRKEIIEASFQENSGIIVIPEKQKILDAVNDLAPEHLELLTENPTEDLNLIDNAGAIFLGSYTPEAVGDYFAGPNHTLPTSGCAKYASPLGVQDFIKTSSVIRYSKDRFFADAESIIRLAEVEGLYGHAESIKARIGDA